MKVLNFEIIKHPMNWVILFLMVLIAGTAAQIIAQSMGSAKPVNK